MVHCTCLMILLPLLVSVSCASSKAWINSLVWVVKFYINIHKKKFFYIKVIHIFSFADICIKRDLKQAFNKSKCIYRFLSM